MVLKSKLGILIDDLFTIVINNKSLLWNQHYEYIITLREAKKQYVYSS